MQPALSLAKNHSQFLNPEHLLRAIPLESGMVVADFGCGNGHYTVAAAALAGKKGQVYSLDILEDCLSQTSTLAKLVGLRNVSTQLCDLEKFGSCTLPETSCDLVIVSSLFHQAENRENILREAYRVLKTGGQLLVVEWQSGAPLGPPVSDRVSPEAMRTILERSSFRPVKELPAGSFHYALLYAK